MNCLVKMKRIRFFRTFTILASVAMVMSGLFADPAAQARLQLAKAKMTSKVKDAQPAQAQLQPAKAEMELKVKDAQPAQAQLQLQTQLWLKADAGVETSDGKVTTWKDQSGNNRNASQGTAPDRPTLVASGLNGHPVLRFDGNDGLTLGNISAAFPSAATLFIVATINDDNYNLFTTKSGADSHGGSDTWWRFSSIGTPAAYMAVFNPNRTYAVLEGRVPSSGSHLFAVESSGSQWEMSIDGSGGGANNSGSHRAGDEYRIGMPDNNPPTGEAAKFLNGDIAEIILFDRALTETERHQVGSYLSKKYGLSTTYK